MNGSAQRKQKGTCPAGNTVLQITVNVPKYPGDYLFGGRRLQANVPLENVGDAGPDGTRKQTEEAPCMDGIRS